MIKSLFILALTGITAWLCHMFPNAATDPKTGMVMILPEVILNHNSYDREISEEEKHWLPSDTEMLKKTYYPKSAKSNPEAIGKSISATLILSGADQRSLHRPEICLDAQGWAIIDQPITELTVNDKKLKVKDLYLKRTETQDDKTKKVIKAHYVYWWEGSRSNTPDTFQRSLISAKENIFFNRNTRWGYPSIMTYVYTDGGEKREDAQKRAYDFIEQYGVSFLKNYQ